MQGSPTPGWLVASTITQAVSAAAVAFFAFVQFRRERAAASARRNAVDTRASTTAFLLRRQLISWIGEQHDDRAFEGWLVDAKNANALGTHLDVAEGRAIELANLAPDASSRIRAALEMAFALFAAGTRRLNQYASTPRPGRDRELEWIQLKLDAEKDLRACVAALENGPINVGLLNADREIDAIRDAANPITQLAAALAALAERKR